MIEVVIVAGGVDLERLVPIEQRMRRVHVDVYRERVPQQQRDGQAEYGPAPGELFLDVAAGDRHAFSVLDRLPAEQGASLRSWEPNAPPVVLPVEHSRARLLSVMPQKLLNRWSAWLLIVALVLAPALPLYAAASAAGCDHATHATTDEAPGCADHVQCDRSCAGCDHCVSALCARSAPGMGSMPAWRQQSPVSHTDRRSDLFLHPPQAS